MDIIREIFAPYSLATLGTIVLNLTLAFALGLVIATVYRWTADMAENAMTDAINHSLYAHCNRYGGDW